MVRWRLVRWWKVDGGVRQWSSKWGNARVVVAGRWKDCVGGILRDGVMREGEVGATAMEVY